MKRQLSFYPSTYTFDFITASREQDQQKVGKISQNVILGNSIKYERRIEENEEEKQLRERKVIESIADGDIWVEAIYDSMVESKPNEIELRCKRIGISDLFGMLSCGLIPCLKHVLKFYDVQHPKELRVQNQNQRTIDYDKEVLTPEEAILIANAADWNTVANCKAACS